MTPGTILIGIVGSPGLLVFKALAYYAGANAILAGLTGMCFPEKFLSKVFKGRASRPTRVDSTKDWRRMTPDDVKRAVKETYSQVASNPGGKFNFPVGRKFAESVDYSGELLDKLPASMWESFTGAGNPQAYIDIKPGKKILDLGCGAGLDLYLYARAAGSGGKVYGLDISEDMIGKAWRNMETLKVQNVDLFCEPVDKIPLPDGSVDLVTANGIYNLSPDKSAVMQEAARVLRPGGRTIFAEIVLKAPLAQKICKDINDWFRCIGGALPRNDFLERLKLAGFVNPQILWSGRNARTGHELALCAVIRAEKKAVCADRKGL